MCKETDEMHRDTISHESPWYSGKDLLPILALRVMFFLLSLMSRLPFGQDHHIFKYTTACHTYTHEHTLWEVSSCRLVCEKKVSNCACHMCTRACLCLCGCLKKHNGLFAPEYEKCSLFSYLHSDWVSFCFCRIEMVLILFSFFLMSQDNTGSPSLCVCACPCGECCILQLHRSAPLFSLLSRLCLSFPV